MINIEDFVNQMQKTKNSLQEIETKLQKIQVTSQAGAGLVQATMNGRRRMLGIEIDKTLLHPEQKTMLEDLVIAVVNLTLKKLEENIKQEVGQMTPFSNLLQDLL